MTNLNRNDPLSHTGREMLSGMTAKAPAVTEAEIQAFLDSGGEIKQIKSRKTRKHSNRSKSHMVGAGYALGGIKLRTAKVAA